MHIHEYQAKELLRAYGIPPPQGRLARSHVEALEAARAMPGPVWVVKAQIHAGGRGKGGGVKICRSPEEVGEAAALVRRLTALAVEKDLTQLEINPLALAEGGGFVALDAKMDFDDSALKRHPDVAALKDREEGDPLERAAAEKGLTYVRLGGSIGTLVNGAGLAMATMDAIKQAGAESANFLDAGGGASEETVAAAFAIMFSDPHVRGVLINIFGGILRCDVVAHGIVNAARKLDVTVPLVVRLEGTNVAAGRRILHENGLQFHTASSMPEAARLIAHLTAETQREVCA